VHAREAKPKQSVHAIHVDIAWPRAVPDLPGPHASAHASLLQDFAAHPDGKMPIDLRATFAKHRKQMVEAVRTMISWAPERIVIAHGRWYESNAVAELKRAFRWLPGSW
jgi:hypothetical protein